MGLLQTIKNKLGIGGVKAKLTIPGQVLQSEGVVYGSVELTSKSDQEIVDMRFVFIEEFTQGRGDNQTTKNFELGETTNENSFVIKVGERKSFDFELPFQLLKSKADSLKEKGGTMGKIGSMAKFVKNEKSAYFVKVEVDVKSAALDPFDKKEIKVVS
ncbi:conserved protein of unknown function [Tenacibaculum sp. 190524A02b]|uniref:Uncharacterized protein n=1 Tax=Tenacibaculum vairaonense TaxID=3137860 RepID=A0ABP1F7H5_9FLAO